MTLAVPRTAVLDGRRAWLIAGVACAANFVTFGALFSFGVFQSAIARSFDTGTGPVAALFSIAVCCYYLAGMVGGRVADRHGVRIVLVAALIALPVGLIASSRAATLWQLYLFYAPLVGAAVGCCYPPLIGVVGRWFEQRRSLAIAIVLLGVGGGTLVMPNVSEVLEHRYGWRTTFVIMAVVGSAVVALAAAVTSTPDARNAPAPAPLRSILGNERFRVLYLSVVLVGPGFYTPLAFYNDYAVHHGVGRGAAAALIGLVGGSSVAARLVFGWRGGFAPMTQYNAGYLLMLAGLLTWFAAGGSYPIMVTSAVLHGLGWAAWVTATPLVLTEWFGVRDLGGALGTFYTGLGIGALAGPAASGFLVDRAGYRPAIAAVVVTTAAACAVTIRRWGPERRR